MGSYTSVQGAATCFSKEGGGVGRSVTGSGRERESGFLEL